MIPGMNASSHLRPGGMPAGGARSTLPPEAIRARLGRVETAVLDVDECLLPGYSQIVLGHLVHRQVGAEVRRHPARAGAWTRMTLVGAYLYALKRLRASSEERNRRLHRNYGRAFRGIPAERVRQLAPVVWRGLCPGVRDCLQLLSEKVPLGVISLGLDVVLESLPEALGAPGRPLPLAFIRANRVRWRQGRFDGLAEPWLVGPADKAMVLAELQQAGQAGIPLVIGHNRDESLIAGEAIRSGGLAIGLGAAPAEEAHFQVLLPRGDWFGLERFLRQYWPAESGPSPIQGSRAATE